MLQHSALLSTFPTTLSSPVQPMFAWMTVPQPSANHCPMLTPPNVLGIVETFVILLVISSNHHTQCRSG